MESFPKQDPGGSALLQQFTRALRPDARGKLSIDASEHPALKQSIAASSSSPDFLTLIAELLAFAGWLRSEQDAPEASDTIVELCEPVFAAIRERGLENSTGAVAALAAAASLLGRSAPPPAPPSAPTKDQVRAGPLAAFQLFKKDKDG